jgi:hypothetical protein
VVVMVVVFDQGRATGRTWKRIEGRRGVVMGKRERYLHAAG